MAYTDSQRRQHILELQKYLHSISLFNDNILTITPDGVYGKDTAEAVRNFQREYGLPQTGNTDSATWNKVVGISMQPLSPTELFRHAATLSETATADR